MSILIPQDISGLDPILLENGLLKVVPAEIYSKIPQEQLSLFCHKNGFYCLPTEELAQWLSQIIDVNSTIEIGSGHGALARYLKIPATDSKLMESEEIKTLYALMGQPVTAYPSDIQKYNAVEAIKKFKPKTVIGCWVTHKYKEEEHHREGNMFGVDEEWVLRNVDRYIIVGNEKVHAKKKILELPHQEFKFPWLFSRSLEQSKNVIYMWEKNTLLEHNPQT